MRLKRFSRKSQASLEFLIILTVFMFFFVSFVGVFNYYSHQIEVSNKQAYLSDVATNLQEELQFAQSLEPGFHRKLMIPATINGNAYNIKILNATQLGSSENISEIIVSYGEVSSDSNDFAVSLISGNIRVKKAISYGGDNNLSVPERNIVLIN